MNSLACTPMRRAVAHRESKLGEGIGLYALRDKDRLAS